LVQLVAILEPSVSRQKIRAPEERKMRCAILSETLWILNNLTAENTYDIDERLYMDHNIHQILQAHLLENFIEDVGTGQVNLAE